MHIEIGWPDKALSPNARGHWSKKARATKIARAEAFYATKAAKVGIAAGDVPIFLIICFLPPSRRAFDRDNLLARCKPILDGMAAALGVDDKWFRPSIAVGEPVKNGKVVITIG